MATEGKRVLVTDRSPVLGGRAMAVPDEGFKVNVGGHLIEDPGSGLTKVFEHVGKELVHGAVSAEMPVWDDEKQAWGSGRPVVFDAVDVFDLAGSRIRRLSTWDDTAAVRRQVDGG
jgi:phytoene dehydrogenase-like protein